MRPNLKNIFFGSLFLSLFLLFTNISIAEDLEPSGPLPVTNQHPLYFFFLNPVPDKVEPIEENKLALDLRYTAANVILFQYSYPQNDSVQLDMEISKIDLAFEYGLNKNIDIQLDIPYLILSGGYLDTVVDFFENHLTVTAPKARKERGTNRYRYYFNYREKIFIDRENPSNGLGDVSLFLKYKFLNEQQYLPAMAIRAGVKFPTGSRHDFLGSGEFDYDVGLLMQKRIHKTFLYFNIDSIFVKKPEVFNTMPLDNKAISCFLGVEYFLNKRFSLLLQSSISTKLFPSVPELTSLNHIPAIIGLGSNYKFSDTVSLKTSVTENCTSASPDIILQAALRIEF
ncbi:MAG: DUF3187 family protein [Candidatus Omnitrophota bacterium]